MPSPRRLNLFAFPTETNALFNLLVLSSITLALFFARAFGIIFYLPGSGVSAESSARGLEVTTAYLPGVILSILALLAVLGVALILYFRHPSAIQRRRKISSISEKDQEIQKQVTELSLLAGIDPPEIQMPAQGLRGTDAQAFGVGKTQKIGLDGGFRIIWKTKPKIFNALIHHELAHFANGDTARSYFSDALWKSLRWTIVLPFVLGIVGNILIDLFLGIRDGNLQIFIELTRIRFWWLLQFSLVLVVAALLWTRLLRVREFYADWRAVLWGSQEGLKTIFQEEVDKENPKTQKRVLRFHPSAKERIEAIEHPEILFTLHPVIVFLAGVHLAFLLTGYILRWQAF